MRLVAQRAKRGCVRAFEDGAWHTVGELPNGCGGDGPAEERAALGLVVLVCAMKGDRPEDAERLAARLAAYRIFADAEGRTNLAATDVGAGALVVSQFTLAADGRKGRRPSFDQAAPPVEARALFERFCAALVAAGVPVATGRFGAEMEVELVGAGPATYLLEEPKGV